MPKRCFDFCVALVLLCVMAPVIAAAALLIRSCLGGPVLFRQQRPGLHGTPFTLYKFRTMSELRNAAGELQADELRLMPMGNNENITQDIAPQRISQRLKSEFPCKAPSINPLSPHLPSVLSDFPSVAQNLFSSSRRQIANFHWPPTCD